MNRSQDIRDMVAASGAEGITRKDVEARYGICKALASAQMGHLVAHEPRIFSAGHRLSTRYFATPELAADYEKQDAEHWKAHRVQKAKEKAEKDRRTKRTKRTIAPKQEPKAMRPIKPKGVLPPVVFPGDVVEVRSDNRKPVNIIIPKGVKVQHGPSWTHDPRYQVVPGAAVVGLYTQEWHQRRAA